LKAPDEESVEESYKFLPKKVNNKAEDWERREAPLPPSLPMDIKASYFSLVASQNITKCPKSDSILHQQILY